MIKKKNLSKEDKKTWDDFIKNPKDIFDKEKKNSLSNRKKYRFRFDLHGLNLNDANIKVKEIIHYCVNQKYKELLFITGKGIHSTNSKDTYVSSDLGKLKFSVPEYIKNNQELRKYIVSINEADNKDGGAGAILIKLRNL